MHPYYNRENFPHFVQHDGPWDIYRNDSNNCAAIPVDSDSGHLASHFGDMWHVNKINEQRAEREVDLIARDFPCYINDTGHDCLRRWVSRYGFERVRKLAKDAMAKVYKRGDLESFSKAFDALEAMLKAGSAYDTSI